MKGGFLLAIGDFTLSLTFLCGLLLDDGGGGAGAFSGLVLFFIWPHWLDMFVVPAGPGTFVFARFGVGWFLWSLLCPLLLLLFLLVKRA
jgi:hypothetical protein